MRHTEHVQGAPAFIRRALEGLSAVGVDARWEPSPRETHPGLVTGTLTIEAEGGHHGFPAVASRTATPADLTVLPHDETTVLITEHVPTSRAGTFRDRGWGGFVDAAGNADLRAPGLFLHVSGKRAAPARSGPSQTAPFTRAGLPVTFTLLVRHLYHLKYPRGDVPPTQRELAALSGASLGTVNTVMRALRERPGMLEADGRIRRAGELEDEWVRAYVAGAPAEETFSSSVWTAPQDLLDIDLPTGAVLGSEIAAEAGHAPIRAGSALIHAPAEVRSDVIRLGRLRPDPEGMIRLRRPPCTAALLEVHTSAPRPLLRADLLLEDDPRLDEIAADIFGSSR